MHPILCSETVPQWKKSRCNTHHTFSSW